MGLKNAPVRDYARFWAEHTGAERVEAVSASDDARLIREALEAGEILPRSRVTGVRATVVTSVWPHYFIPTSRSMHRLLIENGRRQPTSVKVGSR